MRESESDIQLMEATRADPQELSAFLEEAFGPIKGRFLTEHGDWWYRGPGRSFVATCDGAIAGFRAMIPTVCLLGGQNYRPSGPWIST